jgi:NAD-dependent dihydropyrimidine dehydrogenase PreA subunit
MNALDERTDRGTTQIAADQCKGCGLCILTCPVHCLELSRELNTLGYTPALYLGHGCTGCGICFYVCPEPGALTVYRRKEARG